MLSPIAQTYEDVHPLILKVCHTFRRRYGGDWDELVGEANEYFMRAYRRFNRHKGRFSKRVAYCVWVCLLDKHRVRRSRETKLPRVRPFKRRDDGGWEREYDVITNAAQPIRFNLTQLLGEVSHDAAHAIKLAVDPPPKVVRRVSQIDKLKRPKARRSALVEYLTDLGWSMARVLESFKEIAEALS